MVTRVVCEHARTLVHHVTETVVAVRVETDAPELSCPRLLHSIRFVFYQRQL